MSKRSRALASLLAMSLLIVTGCGGKDAKAPETSTPAPAANTKAPDPVTLNMWIMPNSSQSEPDMLETLKPFLEKNKHITVKVTVLDWGAAWPKITAAATSGEGPDILQLGTTWVPAIAAMDSLEPLTNKVSEVGGKDAFWPASWNTTGIAGKPDVYALPWFVDARAAFYRTDAFQKAGVDPKEAFK
ncbi:MAG TPA: extracellular solute-binding protein, partial [Symbiobacteriaceae bacterium]|nr:extracellular solute-binding protein [Symbiobacteriaceae bacterium]